MSREGMAGNEAAKQPAVLANGCQNKPEGCGPHTVCTEPGLSGKGKITNDSDFVLPVQTLKSEALKEGSHWGHAQSNAEKGGKSHSDIHRDCAAHEHVGNVCNGELPGDDTDKEKGYGLSQSLQRVVTLAQVASPRTVNTSCLPERKAKTEEPGFLIAANGSPENHAQSFNLHSAVVDKSSSEVLSKKTTVQEENRNTSGNTDKSGISLEEKASAESDFQVETTNKKVTFVEDAAPERNKSRSCTSLNVVIFACCV